MNKTSGGDGIPVELFQILKDDAVKVLHLIFQQMWKTQQRLQEWKRSVFIPISKKDNAKECSNYCTIVLISHASMVILKIHQTRLWTEIFQIYKLKPETKLRTFLDHRKGRRIPEKKKKSTSASLPMLKPLCGSQETVENS